ncbi:hypothetical protein EI613_16910 [Azospirillum sp. 412522]|nr:hypothetical protein [Azospirillum sp. 412522]MBY6263582.1 hypothetical protein [Azospirillum sp. 412522]
MTQQNIDILTARAALDKNYILLLTTNSRESDAVRAIIKDIAPAVIRRATRGARIGRLGKQFCIHLNGTSGAQEHCSIGSLTRWMMRPEMPQPKLVVVVGFAWGNPAHVQAGDVIIASKIHDINRVHMEKGKIKRCVADRVSPLGAITECIPGLPALKSGRKILSGELASAEIYLSDTPTRNSILEQLPEVLGGEMEAFDVVRDLGVPWLFIKAVSDHGDDEVDRTQQNSAAQAAASLVLPILEALSAEGMLNQERQDVATQRLTEALIGHAIRISRPVGDRDAIVDAMNVEVPRIMQRLLGYMPNDDEHNHLLAETLAVAMVEIAQNAFLHGNASYANCGFNETKVVLSDNGMAYDPRTLSGERGGAKAWSDLNNTFLASDFISFSRQTNKSQGNVYTFKFNKINAEIRQAKSLCTVTDVPPGSGFMNSSFAFNPTCEILYYEAREIYTMSKRNSTWAQLDFLLDAGKSLIIACRDQRQVMMYEEALKKFTGPQLRIFVASRI